VIATVLTAKSGPGAGPVTIVGVVVAYLTAIAMDRRQAAKAPDTSDEAPAAGQSGAGATPEPAPSGT
jgi:hypothetical protein